MHVVETDVQTTPTQPGGEMTERTTRDMTTERTEATGEKADQRPTDIEDPREPTLKDLTSDAGDEDAMDGESSEA